MRNLKLGKILNKTIILIVTLALFCSVSVSAAVTLDAVVTKDNATLTVSCGDSFAGKNVVVQVFEPTGSVEDLDNDGSYTVTDKDILEGALAAVYHGKLDANGEVTFTVAPTGPKGVYGVRISVKSIYEVTETEFVFSSEDDAQQIIDNLADDLDADAVAAALYKDTEASDRVYQPYQILTIAESDYYDAYDNADDTFKGSVHNNIVENFNTDSDVTPTDFIALFEEAVAVENVNVLEGASLEEYIDNNADILGLSERNEYKTVYSNTDRFSAEDKASLLAAVEDANLTTKSAKEVADFFCEKILVNILPEKEDAPGVVDSFILEFDTTLEANGADMEAYKNAEKPLDICADVVAYAPFESIADFTKALNEVMEDAEDAPEAEKPSKPSGNTSGLKSEGSSGGGGGGGTSYTPKDEVKVPEVAEPVAPVVPADTFTDIADVAWAHEAINALKDEGIIAGKGEGKFAPKANVTREEFVKMLVLALGITDTDAANPEFADVAGSEWFAQYVYTAYKNGLVNGVGEGFGVGSNITRQDMAVLCARAIEAKGVALETVRENMTFTDAISDYAQDAVSKLWSAGLVNGKSETEFAPKATATRAEAAKMLYEVLKAIR